jgi:hypothetical protein
MKEHIKGQQLNNSFCDITIAVKFNELDKAKTGIINKPKLTS